MDVSDDADGVYGVYDVDAVYDVYDAKDDDDPLGTLQASEIRRRKATHEEAHYHLHQLHIRSYLCAYSSPPPRHPILHT